MMPAGIDITAPVPVPALPTVSVARCSVKIAVMDRAVLIVTVQVAPETESHPVHPPKVDFKSAEAVSVTAVLIA